MSNDRSNDGGRDPAQEAGMFKEDDEERAFIERIAKPLRAAEPLAADFMDRLAAAVRADGAAAPGAAHDAPTDVPWWRKRTTIRVSLSPIGGLALAAGLAAVVVLGALVFRTIGDHGTGLATADSSARTAAVRTDTVHIVRFVFIAPRASSVALVGDFNNWRREATPLRPTGSAGIWSVSVPMSSGSHQYAFVINGTEWAADPAAGTSVTDDFGTTTSVMTVGGAG